MWLEASHIWVLSGRRRLGRWDIFFVSFVSLVFVVLGFGFIYLGVLVSGEIGDFGLSFFLSVLCLWKVSDGEFIGDGLGSTFLEISRAWRGKSGSRG